MGETSPGCNGSTARLLREAASSEGREEFLLISLPPFLPHFVRVQAGRLRALGSGSQPQLLARSSRNSPNAQSTGMKGAPFAPHHQPRPTSASPCRQRDSGQSLDSLGGGGRRLLARKDSLDQRVGTSSPTCGPAGRGRGEQPEPGFESITRSPWCGQSGLPSETPLKSLRERVWELPGWRTHGGWGEDGLLRPGRVSTEFLRCR